MKDMKVIHEAISRVHEWGRKYMNALLELTRKTRKEEKLENVKIRMLKQSKK